MKTFLIAVFFIACNNKTSNNTELQLNEMSGGKIDTAYNNIYKVTAHPDIFEAAFFLGTKANMDTFPISFYAVNIGRINIESGKIIAIDPVVMHDAKPFTQTFPTGKFPVQLAIAKIDNDERVAFSRILFTSKPAVRWEFALQEGEKQMPIGEESFYGYGVDAGIGLFIDEKANNVYTKSAKSNPELQNMTFIDQMENHSRPTWDYILYEFGKHNLAAFSTGYGDGSYATYVGYDEQGNICQLLTDFGLVEWWKKKV